MGGRISCSCPESYGFTADENRFRIHAELFELSSDGSKWLMVEQRLLYITVQRENDRSLVTATNQTGKTLLETSIRPGQKVEKISDCFVFWKDEGGRTYGVNTLSNRDAANFVARVTAPPTTTPMLQHNIMSQVSLIASWSSDRLEKKNTPPEATMVSMNPLSIVFHYNHGLVNVDLLECTVHISSRPSVLFLSYADNIFEFEFNGEAEKFMKQLLNMSSLLLARTTCNEVAITYLKRQLQKNEERRKLLRHAQVPDVYSMEKLVLKDFAVQQRLAALENEKFPGFEYFPPDFASTVRDQLVEGCEVASLFVIYSNMYGFRMWRKGVDVRVNDLRALVSQPSVDYCNQPAQADYCTPSTSRINIPIQLPNGKVTVVNHSNENPSELLALLCDRLSVDASLFEIYRSSSGQLKLRLLPEYEVIKTSGKLGLTIYAHNDKGRIKAEVRGVATYTPGGASIGDIVVSVDGILISQVGSAGDVEKLLREGKVIRLRRKNAPKVDKMEKKEDLPVQIQQKLRIAPPVRADSRVKDGERLLRGLMELLQTEKKYVEDIKEMIQRFLSITIVRDIMESAFRLQKVQIGFLDSMEESLGDVVTLKDSDSNRSQVKDAVIRLSALFVNRCGEFKIYAEYAAAYLRLQREIALNKEVLQALEAANSSGEQHCSYESKMIRPVQRIVQYPLLLRTIQAGCEADSLEARQVDSALTKMQTLAEYVNEMQRIHEQFAPHIENVRKIYNNVLVEKSLRLDIRYLLIFAHIRWMNGDRSMQDYVIFVFQSIILLMPAALRTDCKAKFIRLIPINEVELEEHTRDDCLLTLIHMAFKGENGQFSHGKPETIYQMACCQAVLKQQILKSIKKAKANFIRETKRPLSGSSQSDGGYGSESSKDRKMS